ncbi:hypothetical protein WDU94_002117 [Cyamophila willieti]
MGIVVNALCLVFCRYWYIGFPVALLALLKIYNKLSMGIYRKATLMTGKTVIVTGATSGIGEATAYDLAARGARVILACRDLGKANGVKEAIIAATNNSQVIVKKLDLSSLDSVREFAAQILDEEKQIHVLINNAGQGGAGKKITKDGLQLGMQVNHFGSFLLTNLLLGKIRDSAPSRIINVSSLAHRFNKLDLNDMQCERDFDSWTVYSNSKLCNILTTLYLSKLLAGTGVTANSVHPGVVATNVFHKLKTSSPMVYTLITVAINTFFKTAEQGAQTQIWAACDPDLENVSGKYFQDCHESRCYSSDIKNMTLAELVWNKSVELVKLTKSEINY